MELFRTVIPCPEMPKPLTHSDSILMLGSCFAENIGSYLEENLFGVVVNPTGILYNPQSLSSALIRILEGKTYSKDDLFFHEGLWRSFDHHSRFSTPDREETLERINSGLSIGHEQSRKLDVLVITLGTAFAYKKADSGRIVSNCHKLPGSRFHRELASISTIVSSLGNALDMILQIRPSLRIIATTSPVRHMRDNPHENSVSKAHLISSLHELQSRYSSIFYFPSYEILIDELRDYRFYASDMAHPSQTAAQYICDRFRLSCISRESAQFIEEFEPVRKGFKHSLETADPENRRKFAESLGKRLDNIRNKYPSIDQSQARRRLENLTSI
ncbi:MAG: GSCFA domain-containing protein [Chitinispirillaceae bacterium]